MLGEFQGLRQRLIEEQRNFFVGQEMRSLKSDTAKYVELRDARQYNQSIEDDGEINGAQFQWCAVEARGWSGEEGGRPDCKRSFQEVSSNDGVGKGNCESK